MDFSRKLQITTANELVNKTKTYNFANDKSSDTVLVGFAEGLVGLTDNKLKRVVRVDKTRITDAQEVNNG